MKRLRALRREALAPAARAAAQARERDALPDATEQQALVAEGADNA